MKKPGEMDNRPHTILLVDDSPINLGVAVESLESHGYDVLVAQDGEEALQRAQATAPDLILLDIMMPGMSGFEVCRHLKAQASTRDIPVIFMTSLNGVQDKVIGFGAGAVDYVTKPLQIDEVRARVAVHLKLRDLQGKVEERNLELLREINERKRIEHSLRESRQMLAEAQRMARVGGWKLDIVHDTLSWSDEIFRIFEIDPEQFGASYDAFPNAVHPDDRDAVNRAYVESLANRQPYAIEHRLLMPDGRVKYVQEQCETHYDADGKPLCSLGTVQDISERKRMEMALAMREREFRTLAENSPDTIVRHDRDCRFVYVNQTFEKLTGIPLGELIGRTPTQVPGLLDAEVFQSRVEEAVATGRADEFEYAIRTAEGEAAWRLVSVVPERDDTGEVAFVQVLTRDITALKQTQRDLEASRARLRELATRRNAEAEEERKHLAWKVHEGIGQYLMAMRMNLSMLNDLTGQDMPSSKGRIPACKEHIENMFEILDKSVRLVREVTGALRPSVLDLGIIAALEWLGKKFTDDTGVPCELLLPEDDLPLDEHTCLAIYRIAEEALSNIARHAKAEMVELTVEQRGGNCYLEVRDDGKGFDLSRLYDQSVVGLSWLREQISMLQGELNVFSVPGQGTVIEAIVPIRNDLGGA
jgi:PAS domain S-box-containing protein